MRNWIKKLLGKGLPDNNAKAKAYDSRHIAATAATQYNVTVFRKNSNVHVVAYIEATDEFIVNVPDRNIANVRVPCKTINRHLQIKVYFKRAEQARKDEQKNKANKDSNTK